MNQHCRIGRVRPRLRLVESADSNVEPLFVQDPALGDALGLLGQFLANGSLKALAFTAIADGQLLTVFCPDNSDNQSSHILIGGLEVAKARGLDFVLSTHEQVAHT